MSRKIEDINQIDYLEIKLDQAREEIKDLKQMNKSLQNEVKELKYTIDELIDEMGNSVEDQGSYLTPLQVKDVRDDTVFNNQRRVVTNGKL